MARYTAEQIYAFARQAGFSPDQSTTMTAIALAESGGDTNSHATHGEDSRGLWQINALAHPDLGQSADLYDPVQNARAAFQVSHGGADVSPWTTTHGGPAASYLQFKEVAQAAAAANGDGQGLGVWTGTPGYGHELAAGSGGRTTGPAHEAGDGSETVVVAHNTPLLGTPTAGESRAGEAYGIPVDEPDPRHGADFGIPLDPPDGEAAGTDVTPAVSTVQGTVPGTAQNTAHTLGAADDDRVHKFLASALAQTGDRYVFGAEAALDDPNPDAFDCSELVQWAAHQAGVDVVDNAWMQYRQMHDSGTVIPVEQAIHTPGALLFSFNINPDGSSAPSHQHVAISLGNGKTIEALGTQYGVGSFDATPQRFQYAAVIPGMAEPTMPAMTAPAPGAGAVGILIPPPGAPSTAPDPPAPDPPADHHPTDPPPADPPPTDPHAADPPPTDPHAADPPADAGHGDDFDLHLDQDPDQLDQPDPGGDDHHAGADSADPGADHTDPFALVDVDANGLDDSLSQAILAPASHPGGDDWAHGDHDDTHVH